jgi:Protein O-mannosyl-transferase TMEM260-like
MTLNNASSDPPKSHAWVPPLAVGVLALIVYSLTAFRTITWWENPDYSLTAYCLGVPAPPGSLLLTLLGWLATRIPLPISVAFRLNLLAALLASGTAALVAYIAAKALSRDRFPAGAALAASLLGGLVFAFSATPWSYARHFTPYVLTAFFTALLLLALTEWWARAKDRQALSWVFLVFLLFGLDFAVHRTNLLFLPGAFLWIGLRRGQVLKSARGWLAILAGLVLGLSFHLLTLVLAQRQPFMNFTDPSTLPRFWAYVSLSMQGGGWLVRLFPRTAPFFGVQLADYLHAFAANFGVVPILLGLVGLVRIFSSDWKKGLGLLALFLLASLGAVVYFNVPAHYFRMMDRHYLPSFVLFGFLICFGIAALLSLARTLPRGLREAAFLAILALAAFSPLHDLGSRYRGMDASRNRFTEIFAKNLLATLPEHSILLTNGDNDTFPLWYLQQVEGVRKDVTVLNIPLMNTVWFVQQVKSREPDFPLGLTTDELRSFKASAWPDSALAVPIRSGGRLDLLDSLAIPDTFRLKITPQEGTVCLPQDRVMMRMLEKNQWVRPVYFACTVSESQFPWLRSCLRSEGLASRVMPITDPLLDLELFRKNLLSTCTYPGYADRTIVLDGTSRSMAGNYLGAFVELARNQWALGKYAECRETLDFMAGVFPPDRFPIPPEEAAQIEELRRTP